MNDRSIVYKYRSWTNAQHCDILYENELYLSSPRDFNDPFDCRVVPDLTLLDTDEKIEKYARKIAIGSFEKILKSGVEVNQVIDGFVTRLKTDLTAENQFYQQTFYEAQDKHYGILSLTYRWDSILMWAHYASYHQGFCVGFDKQKLDNSQLFGKGGPVDYNDEFPRIDPFDNDLVRLGFIETHTKATNWAYEDEYRLFQRDNNGYTTDKRKIKVPNDFFKEIIVGLSFPEADISKIKRLADHKEIKAYRIRKTENRFELEKTEI
jgi:hypothetical protein